MFPLPKTPSAGLNNGRNILAIHEYLVKEDGIHTAPTQPAVSGQAFALDAWVPTDKAGAVKAALKDFASHMEVEAFVDDHHHHDDDHDGHDDHHEPTPPVALETGAFLVRSNCSSASLPPSLRYFDPTFFMMLTFPVIYGLSSGTSATASSSSCSASISTDPSPQTRGQERDCHPKWMGVWCMIWGFLFAEGFGFVWDDTGRMGDASRCRLLCMDVRQHHLPLLLD